MANIREERRRNRLNRIKKILKGLKAEKLKLNKEHLIARMMYDFDVSRRVAKEDVEAMQIIIDMEGFDDEKESTKSNGKNRKQKKT